MAAAGLSAARYAFGQGKCRDGYGTPSCPLSAEVATAPIKPVFAPTGWRTVALDHITLEMPDYQKEAAFFIALLGWKFRSDDGKQAVLDIGDWGSAILKQAPEQNSAIVKNFCFVIEPWNTKSVESELRKRGLNPVAEKDGKGFESFHVKDPDGWDLQISNDNSYDSAVWHRKNSIAWPQDRVAEPLVGPLTFVGEPPRLKTQRIVRPDCLQKNHVLLACVAPICSKSSAHCCSFSPLC